MTARATPVAPADDPQTELRRVVERWQQLPLGRALASSRRVRELVQALADAAALESGMTPASVPDLGPGVVMDQLTVVVYDAAAAGLGEQAAQRLAELRRDLAGPGLS